MEQGSKKILGLDPGLSFSGYGIVEVCGNRIACSGSGSIAMPDHRLRLQDKIKVNFDGINSIISSFNPDEAAIEEIFYAKNVRMAIELAHIRGTLILACKLKGIPVYEYSPLEIKQAVVGYGRATKDQVHRMVKTILREQSLKDSHSSDALAAAICHSNTGTLSSKIRDLMI